MSAKERLHGLKALAFTTELRNCAALLFAGVVLVALFVMTYRITGSHFAPLVMCSVTLHYMMTPLSILRDGNVYDPAEYDCSGKTFAVTGGGRGIGLEVVVALMQSKASSVVVLLRNSEKRKKEVQKEVELRLARYGTPMSADTLRFVDFDLCSKSSVVNAANSLKEMNIDVLICNAAIITSKQIMEVNWKNHVVLIEALKSQLKRCVLLSSCGHGWGTFKIPSDQQSRFPCYGTSKLAMLFEARYLSETYGLEAVSVHPGCVNTDMLQGTIPEKLKCIGSAFCKSVRAGGLTVAYCGVIPKVTPGAYYDSCREAPVWSSALCKQEYDLYKQLREKALA